MRSLRMDLVKRKPVIVANWKMYKSIGETVAFIRALAPRLNKTKAEVFIAAPFTAINAASEAAKSTSISIGAQNMNAETEGAFTGEIAGKQLVDAGAQFVIL